MVEIDLRKKTENEVTYTSILDQFGPNLHIRNKITNIQFQSTQCILNILKKCYNDSKYSDIDITYNSSKLSLSYSFSIKKHNILGIVVKYDHLSLNYKMHFYNGLTNKKEFFSSNNIDDLFEDSTNDKWDCYVLSLLNSVEFKNFISFLA